MIFEFVGFIIRKNVYFKKFQMEKRDGKKTQFFGSHQSRIDNNLFHMPIEL